MHFAPVVVPTHRRRGIAHPASLGVTPNHTWAGSVLMAPHAAYRSVAATFRVPSYLPGVVGQTVALWVGLGGIDGTPGSPTLAQAGVASTRLPNGTIQSSLIAQDWPRPWKARIGVNQGDEIAVYCGPVGGRWVARVVDETTGAALSVPVMAPRGGGWSTVEAVAEIRRGDRVLGWTGVCRFLDLRVNGAPIGEAMAAPGLDVAYYELQVAGPGDTQVSVATGAPFAGGGVGIRWLG